MLDFLKKKELEEIEFLKGELQRYQAISDIEAEAKRQKDLLADLVSKKESEIKEAESRLLQLNADYQKAHEIYTRLKKEAGLYENKLDLIEYGVYEPIYNFEQSDDYRNELAKIVEQQKDMITAGTAAVCRTEWTVNGSKSEGKVTTKRYIKLALRAFNGECDALIAKVKWHNVNQMMERINRAFETINKLGESQTVSIQPAYLNLRLKELYLEYEYQLKKHQEKEDARAAREALREEEKARREYEQAQKEAEKEEANYQKALEKAKKEIAQASGDTYEKLLSQITKLEQELKEAHERKERAISMAQQTKRGHVYIISNIGSFGEQVYKIGMTRRLEPEDRVRELGDASVPFQFDIHAMIYSEDAPGLENELHKAFSPRKLNMLNPRKEFFKVTLEEIEQEIKKTGLNAEFIRMPEAMEYRESISILTRMNTKQDHEPSQNQNEEEFPESLM